MPQGRFKMKLFYSVLFTIITVSLLGNWTWATSPGGDSMERIWDIESDSASNIYVAGDYADSLVVNGQSYAGYGVTDSFVLKYSSAGTFLWARAFGSATEDSAISLATDPIGNCYVSGYFTDSLRVGNQLAVSHGGWDIYVLKFGPQGDLLWLRSFGGALNDIGYGLAVSSAGRVYIAGWFADTISLPDGSSLVSAGGSDIFCIALDVEGNLIWSRRAGHSGVDYGYQVAADETGNAYITGNASAGAVFGDFNSPSNSMFVAKLDQFGEFQWLACGVGGLVVNLDVQRTTGTQQFGMACGRISGAVTYGDFTYSPVNGSDDAYYAKFDANTGQWLALSTFGGSAADNCKDVDLSSGPVMVFNFEGTAQFGSQAFSSNGERDLVLAYGEPLQFVPAGGEFSEVPSCIKQLPNGKIAIAGWHFGSFRLGEWSPDSGSATDQNAFIACFDPSLAAGENIPASSPALKLSPNPFSSELRVMVPKSDNLVKEIRVYNLRGQQIRVLQPIGNGTSETSYCWDGRDQNGAHCRTGLYLIRSGRSFAKVLLAY